MKPIKGKTFTEAVIDYTKEGNYFEALKIAKNFTRFSFSPEEQGIIRRAYEMYKNESFYNQLGFKKEVEIERAVQIIKTKYSI